MRTYIIKLTEKQISHIIELSILIVFNTLFLFPMMLGLAPTSLNILYLLIPMNMLFIIIFLAINGHDINPLHRLGIRFELQEKE